MPRVYYPGQDPAPHPTKGPRELRFDQLIAIYTLVREMTTGSKSALVGAGMGSGKTVVSVEVMLKTQPKRALVVGVKDAFGQWAEALESQQGGMSIIGRHDLLRIDGSSPGRDNLKKLLDGDDGWFYVGLEFLRSQDWDTVSETYTVDPAIAEFFEGVGGIAEEFEGNKRAVQRHTYKDMKPVDLLISDESHKHSNQKTASIKTVREIPAIGKIALSGTFFGNRFENAWVLATWLWGKAIIGAKGTFEAAYCIKVPLVSKTSGKRVKTPGGFPLSKIMGEKNPGEYVETLPCYVFIATPIGPPPEPEVVQYELHPEQMRQYREMETMALTWIPSTVGRRAPLVADLPLTQRMRLRTAALGGMTLVPGLADDDPDSITFEPGTPSSALVAAHGVLHRPSWRGKKALILTHSKPFAIEAARRIGQKYTVALKTGDTKNWDEMKARFMLPMGEPGSIQYLVAVISAVGTATDGLQVNCAKVLWLSEDDNNVNNIQGANRVWRDGVELADYEGVKLVASGTIAQGILKKNQRHKASVMDSVKGAQ